ncbi:uncharacterized protein LOC111389415 [Olea europaea var. sylvestris]|uniref:uncharacterized protein LOC111389415 n=1 Tax=Olea europaea var. sylvestris TaxID=158386 RepID=UPI000C1D56AD|nr:uncharacterized protein LOC111389415 [Olea europaea var. sylvestris]
MEELETFSTNPEDPSQVLRMGKALSPEVKEEMISFLKRNLDKRRALNPERYEALKDEVGKFSRSGFIREVIYPKPTCGFTAGHELLSFTDAYSGYNQIPMFRPDEEATSFITDRGLYWYKVMPFGLNNVGATYQRLFLGYIVNQRGIEANPVKITALLEMRSPQKSKEVQSLNGQIAALSRFISRATDKSLPFFNVLKQGKKFQWTSKCKEAFQELKKYLGEAPLFSKHQPEKSLLLYLVISDVAISAVLVREENECQLPVYYISKAPLLAETRYPDIEKLRTDASGCLLKWAIELLFRPRHAIKGQALADFVAEFTKAPKMEATMEPAEPPTWKLFVDGSSGEAGTGAGIVLESSEGHKLNYAVRFGFKASSNATEYEALPVNESFAAKDSSMATYLKLVLDLVPQFQRFELIQVPRLENTHADALSKLARKKDSELLKVVPIEQLSKPSIFGGEEVLWIEGTPLWMHPIIAYLKDQTLPASRSEARKLRRRAAHFILQ